MAVIILISVGGFVLATVTNASIGNLQIYQGSAEIIRDSKSKSGQSGSAVNENDTVKTSSGSKIAIILKDSSVVRIDENSEVEIADISYQKGKIKDAVFKLKIGRFWSRVAPLQPGGNFGVETPTVVASVRGTSFNTTYNPTISGVYVYKRQVGVTLKKDPNKAQTVLETQLLRMRNENLDEDFAKGPIAPDSSYMDDWIKFNQEEDDKICRDHPKTAGCEDYTFSTPSPSSSPNLSPNFPAVQGAKATPQIIKPTLKPTVKPTPTLTQTANPTTVTSNPTPSPTPSPTPNKTLVGFSITHDNTQNDCYSSCQFSAWAYYSDNPNKAVDVTKDTKWSLKSPANGTISSSGFYTSGNIRGDTIQAEYANGQDHGTATHKISEVYSTPTILY